MNGWEQFKKKPEQKPEGRKIGGCYRCQFCPDLVMEATYYPLDEVLRYKCKEGHTSFIEGFKVAF